MPTVEFLEDYKRCHKKGDVRDVSPAFAYALKEMGIVKEVEKPERHKMITKPTKAKGHNIPGFTG